MLESCKAMGKYWYIFLNNKSVIEISKALDDCNINDINFKSADDDDDDVLLLLFCNKREIVLDIADCNGWLSWFLLIFIE